MKSQKEIELFERQKARAIEGFHLKPKQKLKEKGYTTQSDKISFSFINTMNKWFKENNSFYPTLRCFLNKTYDIIQFYEKSN